MAEITLIEGLRQAMDEELGRDERVFIVGEDVGPRGGVFGRRWAVRQVRSER